VYLSHRYEIIRIESHSLKKKKQNMNLIKKKEVVVQYVKKRQAIGHLITLTIQAW